MRYGVWISSIVGVLLLGCIGWYMVYDRSPDQHGVIMDAQLMTSTNSGYLQRFGTGQYDEQMLIMTGDFIYYHGTGVSISGVVLVEYDMVQGSLTNLSIQQITGQKLSYASQLFLEQVVLPHLSENILSGQNLTGTRYDYDSLFAHYTERTRIQTKPSLKVHVVHRCPTFSLLSSGCHINGKLVLDTPLKSGPISLIMQGTIIPYFLQ